MSHRSGLWISAALMAAGVVGAFAWTILRFDAIAADAESWARVEVPGSGSARLEAREYVLYLEGPRADENEHPVKIVLRHRPSERRVSARPYDGTFAFTPGEEVPLAAIATVTPPRAGVYDVRTSGDDDLYGFDLAFGAKIAGRLGLTMVGMFAIPIALAIPALLVLVVSGVWRTRDRRWLRWNASPGDHYD